MTYPPSSSGYPPSQQPTTQFSAPTQQFGKVEQPSAQAPGPRAAGRRWSEQAAVHPARRRRGARPARVSVQLRAPVHRSRDTDFPQLGSASGTSLGLGLAVIASLLSALIAAASLLPKQKAPIGIIAAVAVLAFLLVIAEIIQTPGRRQHRLGAVRRHRPDVPAGRARVSARCCSTRASSRRPCRSRRSTSSRSTASTAPRASTTASTRRTRVDPAAASALPGPVRRRLLGRTVVRRWLRRDRPAERPADPADRFPDLRPAAGDAVRADGQVPGAAAVVVFVGSVRSTRRHNPGRASVNPARASKELLYR